MELLSVDDFKEKLEKHINGRNLIEVAPELGVSFQFLSQVRRDKEWPGKKIAGALGYEEVRAYRKIRKPAQAPAPKKAAKPRAKKAGKLAVTGKPMDQHKRDMWREQKRRQRAAKKQAATA